MLFKIVVTEKLDFFHSMEVLFPEYFQNISMPRKTFPYYGIGHSYGIRIFQPFSLQYFQNISTL